MNGLVFTTLYLVVFFGLVVWLQVQQRARARESLVCLRLRFPRGLDERSVQHLLAGVTGLLPPWWKRWLGTPVVILETEGTAAGIAHRLLVPEHWQRAIEQQLQAAMPDVRYEQIEDEAPMRLRCAAEYRLRGQGRQLNVDAADLAAKLLGSLQSLGIDERIVVQWLLSPHRPVTPVRVAPASSRRSWWDQLFTARNTVTTSEQATAIRQKHAHPLLLGVARIGSAAPTTGRARQLLRHAEVAWHGSRAAGVHLQRRVLPNLLSRWRIVRRSLPWVEWPGTFNTIELAGLIGWPVGVTQMPGLPLGGCRQLAPSPAIPTTGTVVADSTYPGHRRPLALDVQARLRHLHVLGPTGTGKSTLLVNLCVQDLHAGAGIVLLDPKGDLVGDVLERIPGSRRCDVVVLDPADTKMPVGLNPLRAASGASAEVVVENLVGLFKSLYRASWGPRTDDIFRAALLTLAETDGATLCEVPLLLTDPSYRRRIIGGLDDPIGLESFWGWYEALSDGERLSVVGPVLNKVRAFTMRRTVRTIVGQATPQLSMSDVLTSGKVLLVSLASGLLGDEAASLLGALVVAELWHATKARAGLAQAQRRPVMAFLDEWQNLLHLPTPMASVLAEARGLGLGLTLAHQNLGQLPESARDAVMSNARSRVCFQLPAGDARIVARDLGGMLSADDLQGLGAWEAVVQAYAGGSTQPPATGSTRPMPPATSDAAAIRESSRRCYGVVREHIESEIRDRHASPSTAEPLRRKPSTRARRAS